LRSRARREGHFVAFSGKNCDVCVLRLLDADSLSHRQVRATYRTNRIHEASRRLRHLGDDIVKVVLKLEKNRQREQLFEMNEILVFFSPRETSVGTER
jgi:hypothetical protein